MFQDRYHPEVLTTPRQVRNTLAYVMNNWRRHGEDRGPVSKTWKIDPYSSAATFGGWKEPGNGHREAGHAALATSTAWKTISVN